MIITSFTFLVVAIGAVSLAIASGIIGTISVLKAQSLIGDAVGHSAFPGIVLSFMLIGTRNAIALSIGALIFGYLAFWLINYIVNHSKIKMDGALALILSSFFGLGMVLISFVQSSANYSGTQGLNNYIFGQAAYMLKSDIYLIIFTAITSLIIFIVFYYPIKLYVFDPIYSQTLGYSPAVMNNIVLLITIALISVGLKVVGAILIVNLLVAPAVTGLMWSDKFIKVLLISGFVGGGSAFLGTFISTVLPNVPTGPAIVIVLSICVTFSMCFSPNGVVRMYVSRRLKQC